MPAAPTTSSVPSVSSHRLAACSPRRGVPASRWCMRPTPTRRATASSGSGRRMPWQAVGTPRSRSEEHTSELQSQSNLVCRLLLEKKKKTDHVHKVHHQLSFVQLAEIHLGAGNAQLFDPVH